MTEKILEVHQSSLKTWRRCHRCYHYKYILKLEKRKKANALVRGTIVHAMIEAKAYKKDPWEIFDRFIEENHQVFQEEEEYFGIEEMISDIMEGYFSYYKNDNLKPYPVLDKDGEKRLAEIKFSVPLVEELGIYFGGTIDMIVSDEKDRIWLMDHKTHKTLPKGDIAYLNPQSNLYSWAMPLAGLPDPEGMIWNYIRWKAPTKPTFLKDGSLSKSSKIDTTWAIYKKAIKEAGLDIKKYEDMKEVLKGKEEDFYIRHYLPINKKVQKNIVEDAKVTAIEILNHSQSIKDRNITRDCSWCEFYTLCQAELKGLDLSTMMKFEYKVREEDNEESDEE